MGFIAIICLFPIDKLEQFKQNNIGKVYMEMSFKIKIEVEKD
jgi:hypothetical protein